MPPKPLADAPMTYLGRTDTQIKVLGHRVELGEIEAVIREVSGFQTIAGGSKCTWIC
jgi:acyl-coenzyme A synthetase/AMP-(fatty) acid ligase